MSLSTATLDQKYAIKASLNTADKAIELQTLVSNPALIADADTKLSAAVALATPFVGAGSATKAVVSSTVKVTVPITGTIGTGITFTIAGGVITAGVLS